MADTGIGLDRRTERVYRKLLLRPRWRIHDLVPALGWETDEVAAAVDALRANGLAVTSGDDGRAVRAVEPCIALPALLARQMREGRSAQPRPHEIEGFVARHERPAERIGEALGAAESRDEVSAALERLVARVERDLVFLVPGHAGDACEFSRPVVDMALRRGARVRAVWASSVLQTPAAMTHARWLTQQDAPPRSVGTVPVRAMLMDDSVAVVFDDGEQARVVRAPAELERLRTVAERCWERGSVVRQAGRQNVASTRRPRSEIVLRLLSEGLTDDAIARRLGCSVRTVRNDVASAMEALNARSRFQAGARAMQAGLI